MLSLMVYSGLIAAFFKMQDSANEVRSAGTWLLTLTAYFAISVNRVLGTGILVVDLFLFLFASFMLYRVASNGGELVPRGALAAIAVGAVAVVGVYNVPAFRPGSGGNEVEDRVERACQSNLKIYGGAVEMYLLDKNITLKERDKLAPEAKEALEKLKADFQVALKFGDYIQHIVDCGPKMENQPPPGTYRLDDQGANLVPTCSRHGSLQQIIERREAKKKAK